MIRSLLLTCLAVVVAATASEESSTGYRILDAEDSNYSNDYDWNTTYTSSAVSSERDFQTQQEASSKMEGWAIALIIGAALILVTVICALRQKATDADEPLLKEEDLEGSDADKNNATETEDVA